MGKIFSRRERGHGGKSSAEGRGDVRQDLYSSSSSFICALAMISCMTLPGTMS